MELGRHLHRHWSGYNTDSIPPTQKELWPYIDDDVCFSDKQDVYINGEFSATITVGYPDTVSVDRDFRLGRRVHGNEYIACLSTSMYWWYIYRHAWWYIWPYHRKQWLLLQWKTVLLPAVRFPDICRQCGTATIQVWWNHRYAKIHNTCSCPSQFLRDVCAGCDSWWPRGWAGTQVGFWWQPGGLGAGSYIHSVWGYPARNDCWL